MAASSINHNGASKHNGASEVSPLLESAPASGPPLDGNVGSLEDETLHGNVISTIRGTCIGISLGLLIVAQTANISLISSVQSPIAEDLDAYTSASWFTSAYLIAMSSITPLAGRLCQIFLPQNYILISSLIFIVGLTVTATAQNLPHFLAGRVLTGIGGAGNFPVGIILATSASEKRRGVLMGLLNSGFTTGVAFGAAAAGALEPMIGWRAVFLVQIPIVLFAGLAIFFAIPKPQKSDKGLERSLKEKLATIDYLGVLTLVPFIVLLLFGLSAPKILPIPTAFSFVFLAAFIWIESQYARVPIVPMTVLKHRGILLTCAATLLMMMARWAVLFYTPVFAIAVRFWSPGKAGSILFATNGGFALGGILIGWIHIRRGGSFYLACVVTFVLFAVSLFVLAESAIPDGAVYPFILATFANGLVTGALLNYTFVHMLYLTRPEDRPVATSLNAMFRGFAGSFGSAVGGSIFMRVLQPSLEQGFVEHGMRHKAGLVRKLLGSPRLVGTLEGMERQIAQAGYEDAIRALLLAGSAIAVFATLIQAGVGWRTPVARQSVSADGEPVGSTQ